MKCEEYLNLMSRYIDGELSPAEEVHWKKHFDNCKGCSAFFASFTSGLELVQYLKEQPCPEDVSQRLNDFLKENLTL